MQILNAPDRQGIEKAHQRACFLNVGISSPSSLQHTSRLKRTLYVLLALSTVPIHLMLNSAIFASLQANNYGVIIVSQDYVTDPTWDANVTLRNKTVLGRFVHDPRDSLSQGKIDFANHSAKECIQTYGNNLQSTVSNVVLVTTEISKRWANLPTSNYSFPDITKPPSNATYKRPDYDVSFSFNRTDGIVQLNANSSNNFIYNENYDASGLFLQPDDPLWAVQSRRSSIGSLNFSIALRNLKGLGLGGLWNQGLGSIDPNAVFPSSNVAGDDAGILKDVVLVNLPQLLPSILYFLYNGMFTTMLAGYEWSLFGSQRRTLHVSSPQHQQRSTYWLQLPWRQHTFDRIFKPHAFLGLTVSVSGAHLDIRL
jgi:hypothetical protein